MSLRGLPRILPLALALAQAAPVSPPVAGQPTESLSLNYTKIRFQYTKADAKEQTPGVWEAVIPEQKASPGGPFTLFLAPVPASSPGDRRELRGRLEGCGSTSAKKQPTAAAPQYLQIRMKEILVSSKADSGDGSLQLVLSSDVPGCRGLVSIPAAALDFAASSSTPTTGLPTESLSLNYTKIRFQYTHFDAKKKTPGVWEAWIPEQKASPGGPFTLFLAPVPASSPGDRREFRGRLEGCGSTSAKKQARAAPQYLQIKMKEIFVRSTAESGDGSLQLVLSSDVPGCRGLVSIPAAGPSARTAVKARWTLSIPDPRSTGLEPGTYTLEIPPQSLPGVDDEVLVLFEHGETREPYRLRGKLWGCGSAKAGPGGMEILGIAWGGPTMTLRPEGSIAIDVPSRDTPGCRIGLLVPAVQKVRTRT
jgi:type VI protein secretion system component Hcp